MCMEQLEENAKITYMQVWGVHSAGWKCLSLAAAPVNNSLKQRDEGPVIAWVPHG